MVLLGFVLTSTQVALCVGLLALLVTNGTTLFLATRQFTSQRQLSNEEWRRDHLLGILHNVVRLSDAGRQLLTSRSGGPDASRELEALISDLHDARLDLDLFAEYVYRHRAYALVQLLTIGPEVRNDDEGWAKWLAWSHTERAALVEFARKYLGGVPSDWDDKGEQRPSVLDEANASFGTSVLGKEVFCGSEALPAPDRM